jgi:hypothetical protein
LASIPGDRPVSRALWRGVPFPGLDLGSKSRAVNRLRGDKLAIALRGAIDHDHSGTAIRTVHLWERSPQEGRGQDGDQEMRLSEKLNLVWTDAGCSQRAIDACTISTLVNTLVVNLADGVP